MIACAQPVPSIATRTPCAVKHVKMRWRWQVLSRRVRVAVNIFVMGDAVNVANDFRALARACRLIR